jgi:bisphosphoglycerate-independent phosphoglycerate mutase (AlkP superfamily)
LARLQFKWNRSAGNLSDVAPTMLTYMGLDIPEDMKGKSFI